MQKLRFSIVGALIVLVWLGWLAYCLKISLTTGSTESLLRESVFILFGLSLGAAFFSDKKNANKLIIFLAVCVISIQCYFYALELNVPPYTTSADPIKQFLHDRSYSILYSVKIGAITLAVELITTYIAMPFLAFFALVAGVIRERTFQRLYT